jgi:hypothetical protein
MTEMEENETEGDTGEGTKCDGGGRAANERKEGIGTKKEGGRLGREQNGRGRKRGEQNGKEKAVIKETAIKRIRYNKNNN